MSWTCLKPCSVGSCFVSGSCPPLCSVGSWSHFGSHGYTLGPVPLCSVGSWAHFWSCPPLCFVGSNSVLLVELKKWDLMVISAWCTHFRCDVLTQANLTTSEWSEVSEMRKKVIRVSRTHPKGASCSHSLPFYSSSLHRHSVVVKNFSLFGSPPADCLTPPRFL